MADQESNQNQGQADQASAGALDAGNGGAGDGGAGTQQTEPKTFDETYVKKLRAEAAANRAKATELEAWKTEREQAEMSELEKAKAEAEAAQKTAAQARLQWQQAQRDMAITQAAAKAGFPPEAALKLADVEIDADGNVSGVDEAIQKLVTDYPGMMPQAGTGSNGSSMNGSRAKKKALTRDELKNKSPEWINANWEAVQAVLKEGS